MRSILIIQRWYRRYLARLEARRLQAWSIYESLEYANENDQTRVGRVLQSITCVRARMLVRVRACASVVCACAVCSHVHARQFSQPIVTVLT